MLKLGMVLLLCVCLLGVAFCVGICVVVDCAAGSLGFGCVWVRCYVLVLWVCFVSWGVLYL